MSNHFPITPTPELVRDWARFQNHEDPEALWRRIATLAAQWGADQELEACCGWLALNGYGEAAGRLCAARRLKPPTLKEQALAKTTAILNEPNRALLVEVRETLELNLLALEALND
jgi:hypothetical protein